MARQNTENSRVVADLVSQSQQRFTQTNESLGLMVATISDIHAQSDKIAKIIRVIDEIAFQTNILALNAAVEAARAGEVGMASPWLPTRSATLPGAAAAEQLTAQSETLREVVARLTALAGAGA